jgi:hypothetical protein
VVVLGEFYSKESFRRPELGSVHVYRCLRHRFTNKHAHSTLLPYADQHLAMSNINVRITPNYWTKRHCPSKISPSGSLKPDFWNGHPRFCCALQAYLLCAPIRSRRLQVCHIRSWRWPLPWLHRMLLDYHGYRPVSSWRHSESAYRKCGYTGNGARGESRNAVPWGGCCEEGCRGVEKVSSSYFLLFPSASRRIKVCVRLPHIWASLTIFLVPIHMRSLHMGCTSWRISETTKHVDRPTLSCYYFNWSG